MDVTDSGAIPEDFGLFSTGDSFFVTTPRLSTPATGGPAEWSVELPDGDIRGRRAQIIELLTRRFLFVVEPASRAARLEDPDGNGRKIAVARRHNRPVAAVDDLRTWLGVPINDVCDLASLNESTFYNWVANPAAKARPSTVWRLMAVWSLAGLADSELGRMGARMWWHAGDPTHLERARVGDEQDLSALADEVADLIGSNQPLPVPERAPSQAETMAAFHLLMDDDPTS